MDAQGNVYRRLQHMDTTTPAGRQALARLGRELYAAECAAQALTLRLEAVERENRAMRRKLAGGRSAEELETLAWERLGLVRPGEIVFLFPEK